jgi:hypothetical protein
MHEDTLLQSATVPPCYVTGYIKGLLIFPLGLNFFPPERVNEVFHILHQKIINRF